MRLLLALAGGTGMLIGILMVADAFRQYNAGLCLGGQIPVGPGLAVFFTGTVLLLAGIGRWLAKEVNWS